MSSSPAWASPPAKRKVPIDVATVNSKDFAPSATINVQQQLDGQIAGANIQQTSGTPGAAYQSSPFVVSTTSSNTNPIIMVDGVRMTNLNNIDPAIVDQVEVVKGPAGAMLYGAKGANGVIQIFTKKGSLNGKLTITFNSKVSVDHILTGKSSLSCPNYHHYVTDANGNILDLHSNPMAMDPTGNGAIPRSPTLPSANAFLTKTRP